MEPLRIDIVDGRLSTSGFTVSTRPLAQCAGTSGGGAGGPDCPTDSAYAAGSEAHLVPQTATNTSAGVLYARMLADTADPVAFLEAVAPVSSPDPVHFRIDLDQSGRVAAARGPGTAVTVLTRWEDAPETLVVDPRIPVATVLLERALRRRGARIERTDRNFLVGTAPDGRPLLAKDARTDLNGMPAVRAAERKDVARSLLTRAGVAIPGGDSFGPAADPAEAFDLLARLGTVVVKPVDGDKGRGVTVGVTGRGQLREAWDLAQRETQAGILIEEVRTGEEVRILVIDGRAHAVARRVPPHVIGDGARTIRELINAKNAQRRTSVYLHGKPIVLTPHRLRLLADSGFTPLSVLGPGQRCDLDVTGNVRTGAEPIDATDTIDPSYMRIVERAVAAVPGLRCAGVDLIGDDLESPAVADDHVVLELNPNPGIGIHAGAQGGESRDIAGALADAMLGAGDPANAASAPPAARSSAWAGTTSPGTRKDTVEEPAGAEAEADEVTKRAPLASAFRARGFTVHWVSSHSYFAQHADRIHGVWGATTDRTAHSAVFALGNPNAAHELLEHATVPVVDGRGFSRSERDEARAYAARWERVAVHGGTHRPILVDAASAEAFDLAWDSAAQHATALGMRVTRASAGPDAHVLVAHGEVLAIAEVESARPERRAKNGGERREERALALAAVAALPGLDLAEVVVVPTERGPAVAHIRADPDLAAFGDRDTLTVERIADRIVGLHTGISGPLS